MKRIFRLSFLALFMIVASCEDATDIIQESELSDEVAFQTVDDLRSGLYGVYNTYGPDFGSNGNGDAFLFNDLFTDNLRRGPSNLGQGSQEYSFSIQPGSQVPTSIWGNRYGTINFANRVLRAIERLYPTFSEAEREEADRIKGQCLAMRALCHFDLLSYFATDYENPAAPGVIVMTFVPEIDQDFPRNSVGEVFTAINGDLAASADLLEQFSVPLAGTAADQYQEPFFVNKDVVKAIRARVALFQGDYVAAEAFAINLITEAGYEMANPTMYAGIWEQGDVFLNDTNEEIIFALSRLINDNGVAGNWYANRVDTQGSPFLQMSVQLYNEYEAGDIRRLLFTDPSGDQPAPGTADASDELLIGKYQAQGPAGLLVQHVPIFRTTEMYLIKAEAEARDGRLTDAAATLHDIWEVRYLAGSVPAQPTFNSTTDALNAILEERRKEFAFEGHRYLDLKRMGIDAGETILSRDDADCASFSAPCDLPLTDYRFTLPIPTSEISANPTIQQNPGY